MSNVWQILNIVWSAWKFFNDNNKNNNGDKTNGYVCRYAKCNVIQNQIEVGHDFKKRLNQ